MNPRPVLLFPLALAGIAAAFFYTARSRRRRDALLRQIHASVEENAFRSHAICRTLKKQRRDLDELSGHLLPVPKGVEKPAS